MDVFFRDDRELLVSTSSDSGLFWPDEFPLVPFPNTSSFVPYHAADASGHRKRAKPAGLSVGNMNKRVLDFARSWPLRNRELERERGHRHMMNERMRREKQKQSYSDLHSLLPRGTKNDKNSIVIAASTEIQDLQRCFKEQQRRNLDLKASLGIRQGADENDTTGGTKVKVRVPRILPKKVKVRVGNPASGVDSMLEVLRCLDKSGLNTTSIKSRFSSEEFSADIEIQEEIAAAEIEKVIEGKLLEAERKLLHNFHQV